MKIAMAVPLVLLLGCARAPQHDVPVNTQTTNSAEYLQIADKAAQKVLQSANESDGLERYKPFKLDEYDRTIREDKDTNGREFVWVMYKLTRPVGFMGHPQHFAVCVYKDTKETRVIGGR